jgi:1-acyl-sn-glycerol-3-phosphate acyltransferase
LSRAKAALAAQELVQRTARLSLGWLMRLLWRTSRHGQRSVPPRGAVIIAFNHGSFLDAPLVSASIPRPLHYLVKEVVFGGGVRAFLLRHVVGQIRLRDAGSNAGALVDAVALLELGGAIALAPEGARSPDGEIKRGRTGVAMLAYATGAPVYPVAVGGAYEAWPRSRRWPSLFAPTTVTVGDPIVAERDPAASNDPRRCRLLTDEIMGAIAAQLGKPYEPSKVQVVVERHGSVRG